MSSIPIQHATITGVIAGINFDGYKFLFHHKQTNTDIECPYRPEQEDVLLQNKRKLVQITGMFVVNDEGTPIECKNINNVATIDLSPITITEFECKDKKLVARPPLLIKPKVDEDADGLLVASHPALELHVFAVTREQLILELKEQLSFLWDTYAGEEPAKLTASAYKLQRELLNRFEEIH